MTGPRVTAGDADTQAAHSSTASQGLAVLRLGRDLYQRAPVQSISAAFLILITSVVEGLSILLLVPILGLLSRGGTNSVALNVPWAKGLLPGGQVSIAPLLVCFVALVVARAWLARWKEIYTNDLLYLLINDLRAELFESIAFARWEFLSRARSSDLSHALTVEIDRVHGAASHLLGLVQSVVLLTIYLVACTIISPGMTALAAMVGVLVLYLLSGIRGKAAKFGRQLSAERQEQYSIFADFLGGLKVAKSYNAEPAFIASLRKTLDRTRAATLQFMRARTAGAAGFQSASGLGAGLLVWVGVTLLEVPLGAVITLLFLVMRIAPRFSSVQSICQDLLVDVTAYEAVQRLRLGCSEQRELSSTCDVPRIALGKSVRFTDVSFAYSGHPERLVLRSASFELPARQVTALIGPSGGGKSTAADLLMGLLTPTQGLVEIDGRPLDDPARRAWREKVAYVPQDVFLLHDTVAANLAVARRDASEDHMWSALERANAAAFVRALPDGLSTILGDRGVRVSGGERQRIALARGLLRSPELLILDEATSALDWENQAMIARSIQALRGEMTVLTIAHRLSMISFADWVVAIEDGQVTDYGSYASLLNSDGALRDLVKGEREGH